MTEGRYTYTAIIMHWVVAIAVVSGFTLGVYMVGLPKSDFRARLFTYHRWVGMTIWLLAVFRLAWRLTHPVPGMPAGTPAWERAVARLVHRLLYFLILFIPITGWLMSSALDLKTVYLGLIPVPDLLTKNDQVAEALELVHGALNLSLFTLVGLHVAAALKHHIINRDDVLKRMFGL